MDDNVMHSSKETIFPYEKSIPAEWGVPQGTNEKILIYLGALRKWNARINLVSEKELNASDFWQRHVLDSLQLLQYIRTEECVLDVGSGAGFPALLLAAAGLQNVHLVESDLRKCEFLKEAARQMGVGVSIHQRRVEGTDKAMVSERVDVITARAFADIATILKLTTHLVDVNTRYVLLKGKQWLEELEEAKKYLDFTYESTPSVTDKAAQIITIRYLTNGVNNGKK
jgi:16S rRNA (guanine527-N7)-methyltransferase